LKILGMLSVSLIFAVVPAANADQTPELSKLLKSTKAKEAVVKPAKGLLGHPYLVPSGPFHDLFDWDTYFMGVALGDQGGAALRDSVKDFLDMTGKNFWDPGYLPRQIGPDALWALPELCKPFLAQMALRASKSLKDDSWLDQPGPKVEHWPDHYQLTYYEALKKNLAYWETARRAPDGLFLWYDTWESGIDNSVVVSNDPKLSTEGVDLQVYMIREYRAVSALAQRLGHKDDVAVYAKKADDLSARMSERMWSEKDGMFYNLDSRTGKPVTGRQWTNLTPLWGVASPAQAKRIIEEHLLNPAEFWAPHGVRTLAATEPDYKGNGYWRGSAWVVSNYLMMRGLLAYGYPEPARELADKTVAVLVADLRKSGGMNECYDPETGAPAASDHFVSWDLLGERMVEDARAGTDPTALTASPDPR
jgi:hypothetical protein